MQREPDLITQWRNGALRSEEEFLNFSVDKSFANSLSLRSLFNSDGDAVVKTIITGNTDGKIMVRDCLIQPPIHPLKLVDKDYELKVKEVWASLSFVEANLNFAKQLLRDHPEYIVGFRQKETKKWSDESIGFAKLGGPRTDITLQKTVRWRYRNFCLRFIYRQFMLASLYD